MQALGLMAPTLRRNRAYYTVQLAELQLAQGHRDQAASTAAAIDATAIDSPRIGDRLATVHRAVGGRP
jgi:hypothetical protein